jgi:hypothetical protein
LIEEITGITHLLEFNKASIAQKMSWAAGRVTTRVEDQVYCLMGLFGVNMPPLYGEGNNAFRRLQLEILEVSDDESIFAWSEENRRASEINGDFLANYPILFKKCGDIVPKIYYHKASYAMTNKGIRLDTFLLPEPQQQEMRQGIRTVLSRNHGSGEANFLALLNCCRQGTGTSLGSPLAVRVQRSSSHEYQRRRVNSVHVAGRISIKSSLTAMNANIYDKGEPWHRDAEPRVIHVKQDNKFKERFWVGEVVFDFTSAMSHGFSVDPSQKLSRFGEATASWGSLDPPSRNEITHWELRLIEKHA